MDPKSRRRVVYLFGAGASHACVQAVNSAFGLLMTDFRTDIGNRLSEVVKIKYAGHPELQDLVNDVLDEQTDVEHVITFLDESGSAVHRQFAGTLRTTFELALRDRLDAVEREQSRVPNDLYLALLDMYEVSAFPEKLGGCLTLNYDDYLERAVESSPTRTLDVGVVVDRAPAQRGNTTILKLHGSFSWTETWPIGTRSAADSDTLWIPPGIEKAKGGYPFNVLWGLAREMLDCDLLRVIGCKLGPNDWDLISLLFTTRHTNGSRHPYAIEVIDSPEHAIALQAAYPYLGIRSLLEIEDVGEQLVGEFGIGVPRRYATLTEEEKGEVVQKAGRERNWFRIWLKQMAEATFRQLGGVSTEAGVFERLLEEP